jgi:hypothetical protein
MAPQVRHGLLGTCLVVVAAATTMAADLLVYTASQSLLSRIYVLDESGSVIRYHEYENYILADLEVIDNQVYVVDWVAPAVFRVDLDSGELHQAVVDLSWLYLYGVAWDGTYFYADEWDLSRYTADGSYDSTASFDEDVMGLAWDGTHLWTLNDSNQIRCWDISAWPTVTEVAASGFAPPSPSCRGLWFDGQYFWTAEALDGSLGWIYQFDHGGAVVAQWLEPAFRGFAAARVLDPEPIFDDGFESGDAGAWDRQPTGVSKRCQAPRSEEVALRRCSRRANERPSRAECPALPASFP